MPLMLCKSCNSLFEKKKKGRDNWQSRSCPDSDCGGEGARAECEYCGTVRHVKMRELGWLPGVGQAKVPCCPVCHDEYSRDWTPIPSWWARFRRWFKGLMDRIFSGRRRDGAEAADQA